jgi:3-hydroxyisobutyrate dehydrogenase-like beta-hydroxyacid dehydrogenase
MYATKNDLPAPGTRVAVLGAGKMGGAIARRLQTGGFQVSVWDRKKGKAEALDVGPVAGSPADAVRGSEVAISSVTGPEAVREIYFGPAGVFEAAAGKTLVEMSTTGPAIGFELAGAASQKSAKLIQAPVMGSVSAVDSGTLVILASAERVDDLEPARSVLQRLGEVHFVGGIGSAPTLKLVANSMLAIVSAAAAELMVAGTRHGLDPAQIFWVLTRVAPGLKVREAGFVENVHGPAMFAVRDILKDLDLGLALYQPPVPLTVLARQLFAAVAARTPELDISAIVNQYAKENAR